MKIIAQTNTQFFLGSDVDLIFNSPLVPPSPGIHGPPGPGTDRSDTVRDFQNFVCPHSVRSEISQIFSVLVRAGSGFRIRTKPLGPGPTGFGPWIPDHHINIVHFTSIRKDRPVSLMDSYDLFYLTILLIFQKAVWFQVNLSTLQ